MKGWPCCKSNVVKELQYGYVGAWLTRCHDITVPHVHGTKRDNQNISVPKLDIIYTYLTIKLQARNSYYVKLTNTKPELTITILNE